MRFDGEGSWALAESVCVDSVEMRHGVGERRRTVSGLQTHSIAAGAVRAAVSGWHDKREYSGESTPACGWELDEIRTYAVKVEPPWQVASEGTGTQSASALAHRDPVLRSSVALRSAPSVAGDVRRRGAAKASEGGRKADGEGEFGQSRGLAAGEHLRYDLIGRSIGYICV